MTIIIATIVFFYFMAILFAYALIYDILQKWKEMKYHVERLNRAHIPNDKLIAMIDERIKKYRQTKKRSK